MGNEGLRSLGVCQSPGRPADTRIDLSAAALGTNQPVAPIADRRVGVKFNPMVAALGCLGAGEAVVSWKELTALATASSRCRWCLLLARWCYHASPPEADNPRGHQGLLPPAPPPGTILVFRKSS